MKKIATICITLSIFTGCSTQSVNIETSSKLGIGNTPNSISETADALEEGIDEWGELPFETDNSKLETTLKNVENDAISNSSSETSNRERNNPAITSINMTDDEIYALGMKRADELSKLFMDFLQFDENNLIFPFGKDDTALGWVYITKDEEIYHQGEIDLMFFKARHDTLKKYDDIYALFLKTCTPEYSTELLKFTSRQYTDDIDGRLCYSISELGNIWLEYVSGCEYISYEIIDDKLVFNFLGKYDDNSNKPYTIILENIDGKWLISKCSNVYFHGYCWSME